MAGKAIPPARFNPGTFRRPSRLSSTTLFPRAALMKRDPKTKNTGASTIMKERTSMEEMTRSGWDAGVRLRQERWAAPVLESIDRT